MRRTLVALAAVACLALSSNVRAFVSPVQPVQIGGGLTQVGMTIVVPLVVVTGYGVAYQSVFTYTRSSGAWQLRVWDGSQGTTPVVWNSGTFDPGWDQIVPATVSGLNALYFYRGSDGAWAVVTFE